MCIILPVSHIPCAHTIAIWQHCANATGVGPEGLQPCSDIKQHEKAVLTRRPCEDCCSPRHLARRGGVAERGNGSPVTPPESGLRTNDLEDDADDSGYHSDVIHEEDEASDRDECPLSPKALAPSQLKAKANRQRKHTSNHRALTRKPSWKPNLKKDLSFDYGPIFPQQQQPPPRRDSIDSLLYNFDAAIDMPGPRMENNRPSRDEASFHATSPPPPSRSSRKPRNSTLLHPSSPPLAETTYHAQTARSFPFPQLVDVKSPAVRTRKNSTLLHPSSPTISPSPSPPPANRRPPIPRRASSLLHPSRPDDPPTINAAHHRTVMSFPPRSVTEQGAGARTLRRMPPLQSSWSEPAVRRKKSVLHSCLSDGEEEERGEVVRMFGRREEREVEMEVVRGAGWVAREGRRRG